MTGSDETSPFEIDLQAEDAGGFRVAVRIAPEDVTRAFDDELRRCVREEAVPGFRAGHAPRALVEKHHREAIATAVRDALVERAVTQARTLPALAGVAAEEAPELDWSTVLVERGSPLAFSFRFAEV